MVERFDEETAALETRRSHEVETLKTKLEEREVCVHVCAVSHGDSVYVILCFASWGDL